MECTGQVMVIQGEHSSKPLKHSIVKRILVFLNTKIRLTMLWIHCLKTVDIGLFLSQKIFHLFGFPS